MASIFDKSPRLRIISATPPITTDDVTCTDLEHYPFKQTSTDFLGPCAQMDSRSCMGTTGLKGYALFHPFIHVCVELLKFSLLPLDYRPLCQLLSSI